METFLLLSCELSSLITKVMIIAYYFVYCRFESIGFIQYSDSGFQTLLMTLVPPAVFIAVMALQLRYFNPQSLISTTGAHVSSQATLDIYSLLPKALRETLNKLNEFDIGEDDEENDGTLHDAT